MRIQDISTEKKLTMNVELHGQASCITVKDLREKVFTTLYRDVNLRQNKRVRFGLTLINIKKRL